MLAVVLSSFGDTVMCSRMEQPIPEEPQRAVVGVAQPLAGFDDLVEDRLEPLRLSDGSKHAADCPLLRPQVFDLARVLSPRADCGHSRSLRRSRVAAVARGVVTTPTRWLCRFPTKPRSCRAAWCQTPRSVKSASCLRCNKLRPVVETRRDQLLHDVAGRYVRSKTPMPILLDKTGDFPGATWAGNPRRSADRLGRIPCRMSVC
jgi:hypothetical protein